MNTLTLNFKFYPRDKADPNSLDDVELHGIAIDDKPLLNLSMETIKRAVYLLEQVKKEVRQ